MIIIMIFVIPLLIAIILFYYLINKKVKEYFEPTLYKLDPSQKIYTTIDECSNYCSEKDCLKMQRRIYILNKCLECKKKGLCLNYSVVEPTCIPCLNKNEFMF